MLLLLLLQIPTPTPIPFDTIDAFIEVPEMSLWDFTDDTIQIWNTVDSVSGIMTIFQLILFISLVVGIAMNIKALIEYVTRDAE